MIFDEKINFNERLKNANKIYREGRQEGRNEAIALIDYALENSILQAIKWRYPEDGTVIDNDTDDDFYFEVVDAGVLKKMKKALEVKGNECK